MRLVGFSLWRSAEGELYVTLPSRALGAGTERRYFDYLRAVDAAPETVKTVRDNAREERRDASIPGRSEVEPPNRSEGAQGASRGRCKPTVRHGRKAAMKARTRLVLGKTQAKPRRHVASPATVREIAQSLGLTAKDLAAGRSLVASFNL